MRLRVYENLPEHRVVGKNELESESGTRWVQEKVLTKLTSHTQNDESRPLLHSILYRFKCKSWNHKTPRRKLQLSSAHSLSRVRLFAAPWTAALQASLSITNSQSLLKLTSITSVMPSDHLILWCPLLLPPSIFPSIRIFSNESILWIKWPKYWSFSFSISPSNEYSGLISSRMGLLDLPKVQETLKNLLQHHSLKASVLRRSVFFIV